MEVTNTRLITLSTFRTRYIFVFRRRHYGPAKWCRPACKKDLFFSHHLRVGIRYLGSSETSLFCHLPISFPTRPLSANRHVSSRNTWRVHLLFFHLRNSTRLAIRIRPLRILHRVVCSLVSTYIIFHTIYFSTLPFSIHRGTRWYRFVFISTKDGIYFVLLYFLHPFGNHNCYVHYHVKIDVDLSTLRFIFLKLLNNFNRHTMVDVRVGFRDSNTRRKLLDRVF